MYFKGKSFAAAAALLSRNGGHEYVSLHCLCQGIEIILKALLLTNNYAQWQPILRKLNHDLVKVVDAVVSAYGAMPLRPELRFELEALSNMYKRHVLRYGSLLDIVVDPSTVPRQRVARRLIALVKLADPLFVD
jgi:hypothetical protein